MTSRSELQQLEQRLARAKATIARDPNHLAAIIDAIQLRNRIAVARAHQDQVDALERDNRITRSPQVQLRPWSADPKEEA